MALTLDDLFASPDHYLHAFEGDAAVFVPMDRAAYHRSIFLDGRISAAGDGSMRVPVAMLTAAARNPPPATGWIFHIAHCGSTLLARGLDRMDANLVLREPLALRQAAVARDPVRIALAGAMVGKRYRSDAATVVKANVPVNFVLPELLAGAGATRALYLYSTLPDYLRAILRSADHRAWLGRVTDQLAADLGSPTSDAERGAALWLAQMRAFADALRVGGGRSLDSERFFAEPAAVLARAAAYLGVPLDAGAAEDIVAGPLFATYSKNPDMALDNAARVARRDAQALDLADEIDAARRWIDRRGDDAMAAVAAAALN